MKISSSTTGSTKTSPPDDDDEAPSEELLEFLGEWAAEDGEWTDPLDFDAAAEADD